MEEKQQDSVYKTRLDAQCYNVTRQAGTERPFTGKYYKEQRDGTYHCICCDAALFSSETKYDSGSGWPSFYAPLKADAVAEHQDSSHGMVRTEVTCPNCDAHLGHVFPDGPAPTGMRYCINSVSLDFKEG